MEAPSFLRPLIEALPAAYQPFFQEGGWLILAVGLGLAVLLLAGRFLRRVLYRLFYRGGPAAADAELTENLEAYPPPPALWGSRRVALYGLPVRLRLVVAAPLGYEGAETKAEDMEELLDRVVPGLAKSLRTDKPRVRIWPTQLSYQGFTAALRRHSVLPNADDRLSRWVLVAGKALVERKPVALGLVLLADQENALHKIVLEHPHQWLEAIRISQ